MDKHTKGPWSVECRDYSPYRIVAIPYATGIYAANAATDGDPKANARLIAAAPELLEALENLHANIAEYARINNLGGFDNQDMQQASAAIAKAKGEA